MRISKKVLAWTLIAFLLWIIGCSAGLPVIPFVETDYFISGSSNSLEHGYVITETGNEITKIEIPSYFPDKDQCLDFWFTTSHSNHILTVKDFKMTVLDDEGKEIKPKNTYLFWNGGSEDEKFSIENYEIGVTDKYVFFRTTVDLSGESRFSVRIKADYLIDSVKRSIDEAYDFEKSKSLTWNELRAH